MARYLTNEVTDAERLKIEAWLDSIKDNQADDYEMSDAEAQQLFDKFKSKQNNIREITSFKPESIRKQNKLLFVRIAAAVALFACAGYLVWYLVPNQQRVSEDRAEVTKIILNDGSLVWVNADSKLAYHETPTGRFAELTGEALFEVAKDSLRPFMVNYKDVQVRVVGTSFRLTTGDSVELIVLTGKVNFSTPQQAGINVTPNERAVYKNETFVKYALNTHVVNAVVANTEYDMSFSNATFTEVITRLSKKFDVTISLSNPEMKSCHLNLDITDHSLESSLHLISTVLNIEYKIEDKNITISGSGCNPNP